MDVRSDADGHEPVPMQIGATNSQGKSQSKGEDKDTRFGMSKDQCPDKEKVKEKDRDITRGQGKGRGKDKSKRYTNWQAGGNHCGQRTTDIDRADCWFPRHCVASVDRDESNSTVKDSSTFVAVRQQLFNKANSFVFSIAQEII